MPDLLFDPDGGTLPQNILRHVDRYGFTTPHVVKRLFLDDGENTDHQKSLLLAQQALDELVEDAKLTRLAGTEEEIAWSFTQSAYIHPQHKLKPGDDLARLWFCCLEPQRRFYATYQEVISLFTAEGLTEKEGPHHNFFHALAAEEGGPVLYRLYLCRAERKNARDQLRNIISKNAKPFRYWIDQGSYGVAVIVNSKQKKLEIQQILQKRYGGKPALNQLARFIVCIAPEEQDYHHAIARHEQEVWT